MRLEEGLFYEVFGWTVFQLRPPDSLFLRILSEAFSASHLLNAFPAFAARHHLLTHVRVFDFFGCA